MNKKILTPLFVAASFLLIGCSTSEIVGRPDWIKDPIVVEPGDLKDNTMKEIYDAIKKLGDTNANVLNKVMYDIGKKQIGPLFDEVDKDGNVVSVGLKTIVGGAADDVVNAFVSKHTIYASEDEGYKAGSDDPVTLSAEEKLKVSRAKIKQQYDSIIERVFEKMYDEVKGGSYTTDGLKKLFSEEEYVRHLKKDFYAPDATGIAYNGKQVFTPKPIGETWKDFVNIDAVDGKDGYLHIMDADGNFTKLYYPTEKDPKYPDDKSKETHGYIGRKILPDIYRELLIEKYVREQRYTNLGRGYARKAQMIKISPSNSAYYDKVREMLHYYAKLHITGNGTNKATYGSLDDLNSAMIGIADANAAWGVTRNYLEKGGFQKINFPNTTNPIKWAMHIDENGEPLNEGEEGAVTYVFRGTKLGDLVEKYMDAFDLKYIENAPINKANFTPVLKYPFTDTAKSAYNDLTNNGAYTIDVGIELKERELLSNDLTQDGWYLKEGGLTDLHEDFRSHLFNISTSNIVDSSEYMNTDATTGWGFYEAGDYARYFEQSDGTKHAYVVGEAIQSDEPWKTVVLEKDHNFYIVQVDEAASLSKLSDTDNRAYIKSKATSDVTTSIVAKSEIVRDITKQVANSDTYKKNAEQYYLMISNILFYDDSVYAYFKSQFPDLFK